MIGITGLPSKSIDFWTDIIMEISQEDEDYLRENKIDVVEMLHNYVESTKECKARRDELQVKKLLAMK